MFGDTLSMIQMDWILPVIVGIVLFIFSGIID